MSKKWCQYCRVNIDYNKEAIRRHEETRLHVQNKEREIKHQRREAKKEHNKDPASHKTLTHSKDAPSNPAQAKGVNKEPHVPKVPVSHEKKEEMNKMKAEYMDQVKTAIHSFIAEKTQGKFGAVIDYP